MRPLYRRILVLTAIVVSVLGFLLLASAAVAEGNLPTTTGQWVVLGFVAALFLSAWIWFLRSLYADSILRLRLSCPAACILLTIFAALIGAEDMAGVLLLLSIVATLVALFWGTRFLLLLAVVGAVSINNYFGLVLILVGICTIPGRFGAYLRELFPKPLRGAP